MKKNAISFGYFFLLPFFLIAQNYTDFLNGLLLEESTREPIAFATIRIKDKAVGVISNSDGSFRIPESFKEKGDFLEISSMGYENLTIPMSKLEERRITLFYLKPAINKLNEVIVKGNLKTGEAKDIIRYAINNIKNNYPQDRFEYIGYYRDYQIKENRYVNLNEAIIEVFDKGFNTIDTVLTDFSIYDYKRNKDFEIDSFALKPYDYKKLDKTIPWGLVKNYGGNELILLRAHDAVRNHRLRTFSYVNQLSRDFVDNHDFGINKITYYDNKQVYEISIFKENRSFIVKGFIYIDKESFAIRKLNYSLYRHDKKKETLRVLTNYDKERMRIYEAANKKLIFEIKTEYREFDDGKLYPNYTSFHNTFEIVRPAKFAISEVFLNKNLQEIEIKFNRNTVNYLSLRLSDFKLKYSSKKLSFKRLVKISPKHFILQLNSNKANEQSELLKFLFSKDYDPQKEKLEVEVRRAEDRDGNLINKQETETLDQFREFFTQQIKPYEFKKIPKDSFMIKNKSLDFKGQPIHKLLNSNDYWMNTPLKTIEQ